MDIVFEGISKVFPDGTAALHGLDLAFETGEFIVLLGPSGSGKTTACRVLAGLENPTGGRILVGGRDITALPPRLRGIGMVFQNYALYSHKTVFENIAYPLRVRKIPRAEIERSVKAMADLLQIGRYLNRKPGQLSGGQAQRVAVARALVWQPDICLMDEPLSNLDALLRLHMRTELKRLHRELRKTFVFVTHDQEEAMTLATRVAVLRDGELVQFDTPQTVYRKPASRFVAEFMGRPAMNTFDGAVAGGNFRAAGFDLPVTGLPDGPITLGIRPEQIELVDASAADAVVFEVDVVDHVEPDMLIFARRGASGLIVRTPNGTRGPEHGALLHLRFPSGAMHAFDAKTGQRL
ncbi:ABC transporter ATP-binding protein [Mesorhizobium sp. LHD-90]|uniref:ABC transporter ATP-binding protein n=1 Tax=Mesorhizobium sp. LHD-90 TaxID=3071414 RepID=UPI0027DEFF72|nr:ABC transporter ATP-binding protein [Mesorhizobium sp. LHD-90]MDQ6435321.1 ABC transporter ATP-binding protein [Mesorhizobium sp. LHD-90]